MTARHYRFDDFELDTITRELRRADGRVVVLSARIFECVVHLIEHRARAVGHDELVAVIWNQAAVGDNVLAQLLARTRKVLEDTGGDQRIIRTVPGFGYQWIAATQAIDADSPGGPASTATAPVAAAAPHAEPAVAARPGMTRLALRIGVPLAGALLAVVLIRDLLGPAPAVIDPTVPSTAVPSRPIAERPALVLPALVEAAADHDWLRLGVMALVGQRLAAAGIATVPSDNVVALTRGVDVATLDADARAQLADRAVANAIVQPRVEALGSGWRVSLAIVHGQVPIRLSVTADADQVLDAARDAADRLSAAMGVAAQPLPAGTEPELTLILQQAQSAYLDGKPEAARVMLADAQEPHPDSTELAYQLALMEYVTGQLDTALRRLLALADRLSSQDDPVALARTYNTIANVHYQHRDFADVARYSQLTIDLLQGRGFGIAELGYAWREQAILAGTQGRYEESLSKAARARVLLASAADWLRVARTDGLTGITLYRAGRLYESLPLLERTADRMQQFQDAWPESVVQCHIAVIELALAEPAATLVREARLRVLYERIEHPGMRATINLARAEMLIANGRLGEASDLIDPAYRQILDRSDRLNTYFAHAAKARLLHALGQDDHAMSEASLAVEALNDPEEDDRHVAWTYTLLIGLQTRLNPDAAEAIWRSFAAHVGAGSPRNPQLYLHLARAQIAVSRLDAEAARTAFEQALALASAAPIDLLRTAPAYVPWLLEHGQRDHAAEIVGRLGDLPTRNFDAALVELQLYKDSGQLLAEQAARDRAQSLAGERPIPAALRAVTPTLSAR